MRRRLAAFTFLALWGVIASLFGSVTALLVTGAGRDILAQAVETFSPRLFRGTLGVGRLSGTFYSGLGIDGLLLANTAGDTVASIDRLEVRYLLSDLLRRRFIFRDVRVIGVDLRISKTSTGRMNYQEVLHLGEGDGSGASPLVELRDLTLTNGEVEVRTPWSLPSFISPSARDSALAAERARPGRQLDPVPDGFERVRRFERLQGTVVFLRISSPTRDPLQAQISSMQGWISDPGIDLRDLQAGVLTAADSLVFRLTRADLPNTTVSGRGRITWPAGSTLYDFHLDAPRVALEDLRWISPNFPALVGRGRVDALSRNNLQTDFEIVDLHLANDTSGLDGRMTAIKHERRGLGFRRLDLQLRQFDLDLVRPFLDTLPFAGWVTGRLEASGFLTAMRVRLDWNLLDRTVDSLPLNRLRVDGRVRFGGPDGIVFDSTVVPAADLDFRTIRRLSPSVRLEGRLGLGGTLDGPWRNAQFTGSVEHRLQGLPASLAEGAFRFDLRDSTVRVSVDADLTPLRFDLLRPTFPTLTPVGAVAGHLTLEGTLENLDVRGDLTGEVGHIRGQGRIGMAAPQWRADSLALVFNDLNLAAIRGEGESSSLTGALHVRGRVDAGVPPEGWGDLRLSTGRIGTVTLDSAVVRGGVVDGVIRIDTAQIAWAGGAVSGGGSLGWDAQQDGSLTFVGRSQDLAPFDSTLDRLVGVVPDTGVSHGGLGGQLVVQGSVEGALASYTGAVTLGIQHGRWHRILSRAASGEINFEGQRGRLAQITGTIQVDSLAVGRFVYPSISARAIGPLDALRWDVSSVDPEGHGARAVGQWSTSGAERVLAVDTMRIRLQEHAWSLERPSTTLITDSLVRVATHTLVAEDGGGRVTVGGTFPRSAPGTLEVSAVGIEVADLYDLLQRDHGTVAGMASMDITLTGTAIDPIIRGTGSLTGGVFGDFQAPFARTAFYYNEQVLSTNLSFFRTGRPVLEVDAQLPLDLTLGPVPTRQLPGALAIRARTDSVDLGVVEAFTPNLRQIRGRLAADVTVDGSWDRPRLGGGIDIADGRVRVPALGVRYGPIVGSIQFVGDSVVVDSLRIGNPAAGGLAVTGGIRLERLTRPLLGLHLRGRDFLVMDVPDFLRLRADVDLELGGTLANPLMTGTGTARNTVLYFSDLLTKDIVNLDDPLNADLVDSVAMRRARLGAAFQSRFLDSLRIQRFQLRAAADVWLRSTEANIQLEGTVFVDKIRRNYLVSGTLNAPRGTYALKIGPITRDFTVERGTVRYFGTPDLNAELDIQARHIIKSSTAQTEDLPVIALIQGTLLVPQLRLRSETQTTLSQSDLVTLLLYGGQVNQQTALTAAAAALSTEIQRSLVANRASGAPDLLEIRPGAVQGFGNNAVRGINQIAAGWQVGHQWFVTLNAGFCFHQQDFDYRSFGASLEYRLSRNWRLQASAEPVQFCGTTRAVNFLDRNRYQFGWDLRWDREF